MNINLTYHTARGTVEHTIITNNTQLYTYHCISILRGYLQRFQRSEQDNYHRNGQLDLPNRVGAPQYVQSTHKHTKKRNVDF